jgi:hypothetical protein
VFNFRDRQIEGGAGLIRARLSLDDIHDQNAFTPDRPALDFFIEFSAHHQVSSESAALRDVSSPDEQQALSLISLADRTGLVICFHLQNGQ